MVRQCIYHEDIYLLKGNCEQLMGAADKDDMLRTTDETRPMGLVVSHPRLG